MIERTRGHPSTRSKMGKMYHIDLDKKMIEGAKVVLMPGDPFRVEHIAHEIASRYGGETRKLAWHREYCTWLARAGGVSVLVTSTGIGGPSTSIAVEELAKIGVRTFVRVGTTGAIQDDLKIGDLVITTGAVRLDGASRDYAPVEYPAVADHNVVSALIEGAKGEGLRYHVGITASSDTFYPGEERSDTYSGYILRRLQGSTDEWSRLNVLNFEMEAATLFTMTSCLGLKGGCITAVINIRGVHGESVSSEALEMGEASLIKASVAALEFLIAN